MKKRIAPLIIAALVTAIAIAAVSSGCKPNEPAHDTHYTLDITYNAMEKTASVSQSIEYVNCEGDTLDELALFLHPNAYSEGYAPLCEPTDISEAYPNGMSYGGLIVNEFNVTGGEASWECEENDHIMIVTLDRPLRPNRAVTMEMSYTIVLPDTTLRYGYNDATVNLTGFYPQLAVYENGGWLTYPYYANGDPLHSDMADYTVNLSLPSDYEIISSGNILSSEESGTLRNYSIRADNIRDYALILSNTGTKKSVTSGDTQISYLYRHDSSPEVTLKVATAALEVYERVFGEYPYSNLSIAETEFLHGGMEYGNLVTIAVGLNVATRELVTAHEIAHQWWYNLVGSDPVKDSWLDEGLTEMSVYIYYLETGNDSAALAMYKRAVKNYGTYLAMADSLGISVSEKMNRPLGDFSSGYEYTVMAYVKGLLMHVNIYDVIGKDAYYEFLKRYYSDNRYSIATPENLKIALDISHKGMAKYVDEWISGRVVLN